MVNKVVYTLFKVKDIEVDDIFIWKLETTDFISITNDINDEIRNFNKKKTMIKKTEPLSSRDMSKGYKTFFWTSGYP